jgi:hypothetical protein
MLNYLFGYLEEVMTDHIRRFDKRNEGLTRPLDKRCGATGPHSANDIPGMSGHHTQLRSLHAQLSGNIWQVSGAGL